MRLVVAGFAVIVLLASPAGAQTPVPVPAPALESGAAAKPRVQHAKPKPAAARPAAGKPVAAARTGPAGQPDIRKWDELSMPAPKPKPGEAAWPTGSSGIRPTLGSGGGGMAIGF